MRNTGVAFIDTTLPGHGGCSKPALLQALAIASQSIAARKQILYLSDGYTVCQEIDMTQYAQETLAEVKKRNTEQIPIHALLIGSPGTVYEPFMKDLAAQNGGTFFRTID
jgi:predicted aldo/keto reductase-like oxidoreductase